MFRKATAQIVARRGNWPTLAGAAFGSLVCIVLAGGIACADDFSFNNFPVPPGFTLVAGAVHALIVSFLEAVALTLFLRLGYGRSLLYALAANGVSAAIGALLYFAGGQMGWKTTFGGETPMRATSLLFTRSLLVSIAEETVVVALLLRGRKGFGKVLGAVAVANAVSYGLTLAVMVLAS